MGSAFMYRDVVQRAVFMGDLGTQAVTSLPLSNLADPQLRIRTRWEPASASVYIDLGSNATISCVALLGTSFGTVDGSPGGPTVRARFGTDAGFGVSEWDTSTIHPSTNRQNNGNIVLITDTPATGRYLRIDLNNLLDTYLDIGRIVAGPLWRTSYSYAYGATEGRVMLDRRDRNPYTGAEFAVPAVHNPRAATFGLQAITPAEAVAEYRDMIDRLGAVGDALWIPDTGLSQYELNTRCIWGGVNAPGGASMLTRSNFRLHARSFSLVERT